MSQSHVDWPSEREVRDLPSQTLKDTVYEQSDIRGPGTWSSRGSAFLRKHVAASVLLGRAATAVASVEERGQDLVFVPDDGSSRARRLATSGVMTYLVTGGPLHRGAAVSIG